MIEICWAIHLSWVRSSKGNLFLAFFSTLCILNHLFELVFLFFLKQTVVIHKFQILEVERLWQLNSLESIVHDPVQHICLVVRSQQQSISIWISILSYRRLSMLFPPNNIRINLTWDCLSRFLWALHCSRKHALFIFGRLAAWGLQEFRCRLHRCSSHSYHSPGTAFLARGIAQLWLRSYFPL